MQISKSQARALMTNYGVIRVKAWSNLGFDVELGNNYILRWWNSGPDNKWSSYWEDPESEYELYDE